MLLYSKQAVTTHGLGDNFNYTYLHNKRKSSCMVRVIHKIFMIHCLGSSFEDLSEVIFWSLPFNQPNKNRGLWVWVAIEFCPKFSKPNFTLMFFHFIITSNFDVKHSKNKRVFGTPLKQERRFKKGFYF